MPNITDKRTLVIVASDLHVNSTVALCPPLVNLDDGGSYHASRAQRWLWDCWLDMWDKVGKYDGWRKVLVLNGDIGELDTKRRSYQLISPNKAVIQALVLDALAPALELVDALFVIRGTQAHTGKGAWLEEAIAADITVNSPSKTGASWYHLRATASGVRFDIAHHASMGGLPWTSPNSANRLAFLAMNYYREMELPLPHVVVRSHNHHYATSADNYPVSAYFTPAWSLKTEYVYRLGKELSLSDIGVLAYECEDGQYTPRRIEYKVKESRKIWAQSM